MSCIGHKPAAEAGDQAHVLGKKVEGKAAAPRSAFQATTLHRS